MKTIFFIVTLLLFISFSCSRAPQPNLSDNSLADGVVLHDKAEKQLLKENASSRELIMRVIPDKQVYSNNDKKMVMEVRIVNLTNHDIIITKFPRNGEYWGPAYKITDNKKFNIADVSITNVICDIKGFVKIRKGETYKSYRVYELQIRGKRFPTTSLEWAPGEYFWEYERSYAGYKSAEYGIKSWEGGLNCEVSFRLKSNSLNPAEFKNVIVDNISINTNIINKNIDESTDIWINAGEDKGIRIGEEFNIYNNYALVARIIAHPIRFVSSIYSTNNRTHCKIVTLNMNAFIKEGDTVEPVQY